MADSDIVAKISLEGGDEVADQLRQIGAEGSKSLQQLAAAADKVSKVDIGGKVGQGLDDVKDKAHEAEGAFSEFGEKIAHAFSSLSGVLGEPARLLGEFTEKVTQTGAAVESAAGGMAAAFSRIGAVVGAAFAGVEIAKWGGEAVEKFNQLAKSANLTQESFAQLKEMNKGTNLSMSELTPIVGRLNMGIHESAVGLQQQAEMMQLYEDRIKVQKETEKDVEERRRVTAERTEARLHRMQRMITETGDPIERIYTNFAKFVEKSDLGSKALENIGLQIERLEDLPAEFRWIEPLRKLQELAKVQPERASRIENLIGGEISAKFGENIDEYIAKGERLKKTYQELGAEGYKKKIELDSSDADKAAEKLTDVVGAFTRLGGAARDAGVAVAAVFGQTAAGLVDSVTSVVKGFTELVKEANNVASALGNVINSMNKGAGDFGKSIHDALVKEFNDITEKHPWIKKLGFDPAAAAQEFKEGVSTASRLREQAGKATGEAAGAAEEPSKGFLRWEDLQAQQRKDWENLRRRQASEGGAPLPGEEAGGGGSQVYNLMASIGRWFTTPGVFGPISEAEQKRTLGIEGDQPVAKAGEDAASGLNATAKAAAGAAEALSRISGGGSDKKDKNGKAGGGMLHGPGSETSDSIPIMASRGEYVVNAAAAKHYGSGFLDSVNARKFQEGGLVSSSMYERMAQAEHQKGYEKGYIDPLYDPKSAEAQEHNIRLQEEKEEKEKQEKIVQLMYERGRLIEMSKWSENIDRRGELLGRAEELNVQIFQLKGGLFGGRLGLGEDALVGSRAFSISRQGASTISKYAQDWTQGLQFQEGGAIPTIAEMMEHQERWGEKRSIPGQLGDIAAKGASVAGMALEHLGKTIATVAAASDPKDQARAAADIMLGYVGDPATGAERAIASDMWKALKRYGLQTGSTKTISMSPAAADFGSEWRPGAATGGLVGLAAGGFVDSVRGYANGGSINSAPVTDGNTLSYHQLDIRTNAGTFRASVTEDVMGAIQTSALASKLSATGSRPSWYS